MPLILRRLPWFLWHTRVFALKNFISRDTFLDCGITYWFQIPLLTSFAIMNSYVSSQIPAGICWIVSTIAAREPTIKRLPRTNCDAYVESPVHSASSTSHNLKWYLQYLPGILHKTREVVLFADAFAACACHDNGVAVAATAALSQQSSVNRQCCSLLWLLLTKV